MFSQSRAARRYPPQDNRSDLLDAKRGLLERKQPPKVPFADQYFWIAIMHSPTPTRTQPLTAILEHAEHVFEEEENALSFTVAEDAKADSTLIVFERYTGEDFFQGIHTSSDSIQALRRKVSLESSHHVSLS
jgi:quinol monooxygenase YgiN